MNSSNQKLIVGAGLFLAWLGLVVLKVPDAADLISRIKLMLVGLGGYHMRDRSIPPNGAGDAPKP